MLGGKEERSERSDLENLKIHAQTPLKIGGKQLEKVIDDYTLKALTSRIQISVNELNGVLGDKNASGTDQEKWTKLFKLREDELDLTPC